MTWFQGLGLLYPAALYLFAVPPLLLVAYLVRERPRQITVSSVIAFRALSVARGKRVGSRPRLDTTFFVELFILCLAVLALAAPYRTASRDVIAVVLDNSAPMQAEVRPGLSRFASARQQVAAAVGRKANQIILYVTSPQPHRIGTFASATDMEAALDQVLITDSPDDPAAITNLFFQLMGERQFQKIVFASYRPVTCPSSYPLQSITVGGPISNYAIGSFEVTRQTLGASGVHGRVMVANFSRSAQRLEVTISADGKLAGRAGDRVAAGGTAVIDFPNLIEGKIYKAQLEPSDAFALDNIAYATGPAISNVSILFVSPTPADGASLRSIPGLVLTTIPPVDYDPAQLPFVDMAVFEYAVPKELPDISSLLIMPPAGDPVFNFVTQAASDLEITAWPQTESLTAGVNFRLLNLRKGVYFGLHPWMRPVVKGRNGALMLAGDRQGHRFVATGFNPLPYLGRKNLPMSILTLNMLSYLAGLGGQATSFHTGDRWIVPANVKEIVLPTGHIEPVHPGESFSSTTTQGIYTLIGPGKSPVMRAVNLANLATSDLQDVRPLRLEPAAAVSSGRASVTISLTPYLLSAIMVLLVAESLLVYRSSESY
jgi:hypothetical protein